jgi:phytoene dehydrogenase-like protein
MMHDVVIIGGGHNGLVCSAYLAMAGLKVCFVLIAEIVSVLAD